MSVDQNPANGLLSMAWESVPTVLPADASFVDFNFVSESLSNDAETIQDDSITALAQRPVALPSKVKTGGNVVLRAMAEGGLPRLIANIQGKADMTEVVASTVYIGKYAPSMTELTAPETFSTRVWRDDNLPQYGRGSRVRSLDFSIQQRGLLQVTANIIQQRSDYWSYPTVVNEGSANTHRPRLQGIPNYAQFLAGNLVRFKVTDVTGLPTTITGRAKFTSGASYGSTDINVLIGEDDAGFPLVAEAYDDAGNRIGTRAMPVEVILHDGTGYQVDDEYQFDYGTVWTPSYADCPVFNEIFAKVLIDDEEFKVTQATMKIEGVAEADFAIGGRFAWNVINRGQRQVSIGLQRRYLDIKLRRRLETGQPFKFVLDCFGGQAISGSYEHEFHWTSTNCIPSGTTPVIGGNNQMDEQYNATCHPNADDVNYPDDVTIEIQSTEADVTV